MATTDLPSVQDLERQLKTLKRARIANHGGVHCKKKKKQNKHRISSRGGDQRFLELEQSLADEIKSAALGTEREKWWRPRDVIERFRELLVGAGMVRHYSVERGYTWLKNFTTRFGLKIASNAACQERVAGISDRDLAKAVWKSWRLFDLRLAYLKAQDNPPGQQIVLMNCDETFIRFNPSGSGAPRRIFEGDPGTARIRAAAESKAGCTALFWVTSDDSFFVKPTIIFDQATPKIELKQKAKEAAQGRAVFVNGNANGRHWMDAKIWETALRGLMGQIRKRKDKPLVIVNYDNARCHKVSEKLEMQLENNGIHLVPLEPHMSSLIQVCDVQGLFRSLKSEVRSEFYRCDFLLGEKNFYERMQNIVEENSSKLTFAKCGFVVGDPKSRMAVLSARLKKFLEMNGGLDEN